MLVQLELLTRIYFADAQRLKGRDQMCCTVMLSDEQLLCAKPFCRCSKADGKGPDVLYCHVIWQTAALCKAWSAFACPLL